MCFTKIGNVSVLCTAVCLITGPEQGSINMHLNERLNEWIRVNWGRAVAYTYSLPHIPPPVPGF